MDKNKVFDYLFFIETAMLIVFSLLPGMVFVRTGFLRLGDAEHFFAYLIYGFLSFSFSRRYEKPLIKAVIIGSVLGLVCELIQVFIPYRTGDIVDWVIDTFGSFIGALVAKNHTRLLKYLRI